MIIKNAHDMIVGNTYRVTYPDYFDDIQPNVATVKIKSKNDGHVLVYDIDDNIVYRINFTVLKNCTIESVI